MTTEIEETSTPKVVNWDVAEERDFEKLRVEMDEHKDKMMALESKALLLRSKLDKKVELSEANTYIFRDQGRRFGIQDGQTASWKDVSRQNGFQYAKAQLVWMFASTTS